MYHFINKKRSDSSRAASMKNKNKNKTILMAKTIK